MCQKKTNSSWVVLTSDFLLIIGKTELFYVIFCQHLFLAEQPFHDLNLCERRLVSSLHARVQPAWSQ